MPTLPNTRFRYLVLLTLVFLTGCPGASNVTPPPPPLPTEAQVSVFNAALGVTATDVYLDGQPLVANLAYAAAVGPLTIGVGAHTLTFTQPGAPTSVIYQGALAVEAGKRYAAGLQGAVPSSDLYDAPL
jgi:hypothetical protein